MPSSKDNAFKGLHYLLRSKFIVFFDLKEFSFGKHCLFSPPLRHSGSIPSFYSLFKRDFFMSFNKFFPEFNSVGESVNVDVLKRCLKLRVDWLLFVYDSGKVYRVSPKVVSKFCIKHDLVRTQDVLNDKRVLVRETTYSFPISLLERYGDV